ncbi:MAG: hemerythrin domain-containing protein [Phycisphaerae bacterium]
MSQKDITAKVAQEHIKLQGIMAELTQANGQPPARGRDEWLENLGRGFFKFRAHMVRRIALEEMGGFHDHVLQARPNLARDIEHLRREHRDILALIEEVQHCLKGLDPADLDALNQTRLRIGHVLSAVNHHAEHEDLLVSFVFTQDIGGES